MTGGGAATTPVREDVGRPAALVSIATFSSRIAGLARESLFGALFGLTPAADAFVVAFRIPNLLRDLFAEGALSSAFVPTFAKVREERGDAASFRLARTVVGTLMAVTGALALLGIFAAGPIVDLIAGGASSAVRSLAVPLTRIMFPFLPLVALAATWMGVLNAHKRYLVPAFAPVAFNAVTIAGGASLLALGYSPSDAVVGWAVFVLVGGLAQALVQWPAARAVGLKGLPRVDARFRDPDLRTIVRRMGPSAIALAGTQFMIVATTAIAAGNAGWVSGMNYAFRLIHLPIGLIGVALGTVSLAAAARAAARHDDASVDDVIRRGLRLNLFLALPAAVGLFALAEPVVRLVYEHGAFDVVATERAVEAVRAYGVGIVFYAGIKVAAAAFQARGDMRRPMYASLAGIAVNLVVALFGTRFLGFAALPLATAVGSIVNFGILRVLDRRIHGRGAAMGVGFVVRVVAGASVLGGIALLGSHLVLARGALFGRGLLLVPGLLVVIAVAAAAHFLVTARLRVPEASFAARLWTPARERQSPRP